MLQAQDNVVQRSTKVPMKNKIDLEEEERDWKNIVQQLQPLVGQLSAIMSGYIWGVVHFYRVTGY